MTCPSKELIGLRLTGDNEGLVITDCLEKLLYFCDHDAYEDRDCFGHLDAAGKGRGRIDGGYS